MPLKCVSDVYNCVCVLGRECVYNDVDLLHTFITLKDLLLRCDLDTATGKHTL